MNIIICAFLFLFKTFNLPRLYYYIGKRRNINVQQFRTFERLHKRLSKLPFDIKYFENCLELGICPTFLTTKFPNLPAFKDTTTLKKTIINNQLIFLRRQQKRTQSVYDRTYNEFHNSLNFIEFSVLLSKIRKSTSVFINSVKSRLDNKLHNLWLRQRQHLPNCVINKSKYTLSTLELNALRYGLDHHILPSSLNHIKIKSHLECKLNYALKLSSSHPDGISTFPHDFKDEFKAKTNAFFKNAYNICTSSNNKKLHHTLTKLRNNKSIKICKYDKGNGVVILDSDDYYAKLDTIINDSYKFHCTASTEKDIVNYVIKTENSLHYILNRYVKPFIPKDIFQSLLPIGSQPGRIYGMCKVHKENFPLRPVVSMTGTAQYSLAQYLDSYIKPNIPDTFMTYSSKQFIDKVDQFQFKDDDYLVSFDIVNLFTNVPLQDSIDLACSYVYSDSSSCVPPFPQSTFKKLLIQANGGCFMHKSKLYKQIDGLSMGNPLSPTLANLFLAHFEKDWNNRSDAPSLYVRYIDDIFAVFNKKTHVSFLNFINNVHTNLKFTSEIANKSISFLDCWIDITDNNVTCSIYRKPTYTNLILSYFASCPFSWKKGLIYCLLHRAYTLSSSWELINTEISNLKNIFSLNGYPLNLFYNCVNSFLNKRFPDNHSSSSPIIHTPPNIVFSIPFVGKHSVTFKRTILKLCRQYFKSVTFDCTFSSFKVSNYFVLKPCVPKLLSSGVVYKFSCQLNPDVSYIGKTKRHLSRRIHEHKFQNSAIQDHLLSCLTCCNNLDDNFIILQSTNNLNILSVMEAMCIKKYNPSLNTQLASNGSSVNLQIF